jgi:adhesin/invasin
MSTAVIRAEIRDMLADTLITNATNSVTFSASGTGTLVGSSIVTASGGIATIALRSTTSLGTATVTATADSMAMKSATVATAIGAPAKITCTASPASIFADGATTSLVTGRITDSVNNVVTTWSNSVWFKVSGEGRLPGGTTYYMATAAAGTATVRMNSTTQTGTATVTGTASGLAQGTVTVATTSPPASKLVCTANPMSITANGTSTSLLRAEIRDVGTNQLIVTGSNSVTFSLDGQGSLVGINPKNAQGGIATLTLRSAASAGTATVTATALRRS